MSLIEIVKNPIIYIIISLLILIILHKESNYINVSGIWKNYFNFLKSENHIIRIFFIIIVVPILLAISTTMIKKIDSSILNNTMVVVSILMSMLFTVLALIKNNTIEPKNNTHYDKAIIEEVKKDTISIIHYLVLLNILIILLSFLFPIIPEANKKHILLEAQFFIHFCTMFFLIFLLLLRDIVN